MSIKIYNGYEIVGHTLESFLAALHRLRPEMEKLARNKAARVLAQMMTREFDCRMFGQDKKESSVYFEAIFALQDRQAQIERKKERDPGVDFSFELAVLPVEDTLLAIVYTEQADLRNLWQAQPGIREFGYWDNSDRPDEVSEEVWAERARLWQTALGDWYTPPARRGYAFTLLPVDGDVPLDFPVEEVVLHVPEVAHRAREVAFAQLLAQTAQKQLGLSDLRALHGSPELETLAKELEPRIVTPLTAQHFNTPVHKHRATNEAAALQSNMSPGQSDTAVSD